MAPDEKQVRGVITREEMFLNLAAGESRNLVTAKLGQPDSISKYDGNSFLEKPPNVIYRYESLGDIQFSARNSEALFVERIMPGVKIPNSISSIKLQLETEGETLRGIAESYYQLAGLEIDVLDLLAEKIWIDRGAEDPYTVDALSWLCKVLAKSNNSRYRSLLQNVAKVAGENKLRRHAKKSLDFLTIAEAEQFVPIGK